jgi:hypothetical protein
MPQQFEIGATRDGHLEVERLLRESGPIKETAVQMGIKIYGRMFKQTGPDLRHVLTGETIEDWAKGRRKNSPGDYADFVPDDPDQLMHLYSEEAFGPMCSPKTVTRLYKFMNDPGRFAELAKAWGCDTVRMLPGQRPGSVDEVKKPAAEGLSNNPWSASFHGDEDARNERIDAVCKTGTKLADALAKAAGTTLGRPLRK